MWDARRAARVCPGDPGVSETAERRDAERVIREGMVSALRTFYATGATRSHAFRTRQLQALSRAIMVHEETLLHALHADLRKSGPEAYASEIGLVQTDITYALRNLRHWMRPRRVRGPLLTWPSRGAVCPEPYGSALIIGPWNYPVHLLLTPLVGAIAAGNCVCLKPSELAPATSRAVADLVRDAFPPDYISVAEGGRETAQQLLAQGFDCIFFTGSALVGRSVLEAAARTLTPATLELGGKNPCIVCSDVPVEIAARRILWGKCLNAGQTCIAPDYILVDRTLMTPLINALRQTLATFFPEGIQGSPDYGRIINVAHFQRIRSYMRTGRIVLGGACDLDDLFIEPTVLLDVPDDAPVLHEEIFGPVLPVLGVDRLDEALALVNARPAPLALYAFTRDRAVQRRIQNETASGGVCFNDVLSHAFAKGLPFGGVGPSGMGAYHGKTSFDCFSHRRSVLRRAFRPDFSFRYPPVHSKVATLRKIYGLLMRS